MNLLRNYYIKIFLRYSPFLLCFVFFVAYSTLSIVKHVHFTTGYDLAIIDQVIWKYSQFKNPITTTHTYYLISTLEDHVEIIYIIISPLYWVFNSAITILLLQSFAICASGIAVYLLAMKKKIPAFLSLVITFSYLAFYGIQNAIWSDVHSLVFAVSFLAFLIYFLETKKDVYAFIFFLLAILCKEDIAFLTLLIGITYYILDRKKIALIIIAGSITYLLLIFLVYYPYLTRDGYRYKNPNGILADPNPLYLFDTNNKRQAIFYGLASYGFLPIFAPFLLLTALGDLFHYFVLGRLATSAQGLFLHYRSSLALFFVWPTIYFLSRHKKFQSWKIAIYLFVCPLIITYILHTPLTYLSKKWFWEKPQAASDINTVIKHLPADASVASQVNILPHISHRDFVYTMFPTTKDFPTNSPCDTKNCRWFRIGGQPEYMLIDTSGIWDPRQLLETREEFIDAINNMERANIIKPVFQKNNTTLYKIIGKI